MTSEKTGVRRAEIGSVIAILFSVLAVVVSFYQARIAEKQAHASVWPYVTIGQSMYDQGDQKGYRFTVDNNGLGPAVFRSVVVSVDGKPVKNWNQVFDALGVPREVPHTTSSVHGRVLPPNINRETTIEAIHVFALPEAQTFFAAAPRLRMDICYCSVYAECWIAHFMEPRLDTVSHCEPAGALEFAQ
jgi:hypothetical protein